MTKVLKYSLVILLALFSIEWIACTQQRQVCLTPKTAFLNVSSVYFRSDTATIPVDTSLPGAVFVALANSNTTTYYFAKQPVFTISLSPDSNMCRWAFSTDSSRHQIDDTLTFFYTRHLQFLSNACGYTNFYTLNSVTTTHSTIDSVHILNTGVTNDIKPKHVQIYIHPHS